MYTMYTMYAREYIKRKSRVYIGFLCVITYRIKKCLSDLKLTGVFYKLFVV